MGDDATNLTGPERDDGYTEYGVPQRRKRKKRSKVWKELIEGKNAQGERIATCNHCNLELSAQRDYGTSHLKRHLERCLLRSLELRNEDDSDEDNYVFNMGELRADIINFIVEGAHSFSIVEENGFKRMMDRANRNFVPFGRATAKRDLLSSYVVERDELKDIWKLHKRGIVRFRALAPPYDGVSIATEIALFLTQWKLDNKILSITVDNGTYNDVTISTLRRRLVPRGGLAYGECLFHVRCCAHIVNLVVQNGLIYISDILDKIRSLIKMITRSSHRSTEFYDCAERTFHLDGRKKLNLDMEVRWNSTNHMFGTALFFKDVFIHLGSNYASFKTFVPLEEEWDKVRVIHDFLELFYQANCMFSAVKHPTSNLYFKGAWMVHRHLVEAANGPYEFLKEMIQPMLSKFDKYWSEYNIYLSCAAILDPRYKVMFVEYCCCKLFGNDEGSRRVNDVLTALIGLYNDYKLQYVGVSPVVALPSPSSRLGTKNYFDDYDQFVSSSRSQVGKSQLDMYFR
ncbi:zinc finger BED domain-containing protein RICESLEEPER 2-like [Beta vulgaris subsp. vulgaris]|uniref:zinc finger BED domain-containing protein RICESLEEPER 2-like n=1 Tax=Beta vulgaris subsp. vulgaris TaxID=3555 RepID=UPI002036DDD1|nr:zinc finger BED domain-containing protein RICESLEEPER 2-like [Beta vulgaris subsp. vulgaris]